MCVTGCPYKKIYFNHRTGKAEKCTFCFPRIEVGLPTVCSETCVGRLRYIGLMLYDADKVLAAASTTDDARPATRRSARCSSTRTTPRCIRAAEQRRHPARLGARRRSAPRSTR
ncbi:MAG: 4Fe-4S dicluster domain-containing protein [Geodermatophilaceae bacterium]